VGRRTLDWLADAIWFTSRILVLVSTSNRCTFAPDDPVSCRSHQHQVRVAWVRASIAWLRLGLPGLELGLPGLGSNHTHPQPPPVSLSSQHTRPRPLQAYDGSHPCICIHPCLAYRRRASHCMGLQWTSDILGEPHCALVCPTPPHPALFFFHSGSVSEGSCLHAVVCTSLTSHTHTRTYPHTHTHRGRPREAVYTR